MKNALFLITTLFLGSAALANKITEKNWSKNPEIIEVRKIYDSNQKMKKGWKKLDKVWNYCEPYADTQRILITDKKDVARIYSNSGGSDDSSVNIEFISAQMEIDFGNCKNTWKARAIRFLIHGHRIS